jgi:hypothetical protein
MVRPCCAVLGRSPWCSRIDGLGVDDVMAGQHGAASLGTARRWRRCGAIDADCP